MRNISWLISLLMIFGLVAGNISCIYAPDLTPESAGPEAGDSGDKTAQSVVDEYYKAVNHGEIGALERLFTDDTIFSLPRGEFNNKEQIMGLHQHWIDDNVQISYSDARMAETTFTARHSLNPVQDEPLTGDIEITVEGAAIARVAIMWDEETMQMIAQRGDELIAGRTAVQAAVDEYYEAVNHGEMGTLEALFTDDIIFCLPFAEFANREQIMGLHQHWMDDNVQISYSDDRMAETTFTARHSLNPIQVAPLTGDIEITVEGAAIARVVIMWDEETMQRLIPREDEEETEPPPGQEEETEPPPGQEGEEPATAMPLEEKLITPIELIDTINPADMHGRPLMSFKEVDPLLNRSVWETDVISTGSILVMFDWSMAPRFGKDSNADGRIDLPNTLEYVNPNREVVEKSSTPIPIAKITKLYTPPKFQVIFKATSPQRGSFSWRITGPNIDPIVHDTTNPLFVVQLPEGVYDVFLSAYDEDYKYGSVSRKVPIEDILIVSIGDSYSSGEGNPENPRWDPGWGEGRVINPMIEWADDGELEVTDIDEDHRRSHRSTLSWPAQAALAIERADPRTSVTFVSVASSGATIEEGILGPYEGAGESYLPDAEPQIDQVAELVAGRQIDALTISIGGNDIGFACVLDKLVKNDKYLHPFEYGNEMERIWQASETGDWSHWDDKDCPNIPGLNNLHHLYGEINDAIHSKLNVFQTYILEYPDPTGVIKDGKIYYCDELLGDIIPFFEVDVKEQKGAVKHVLQPLNEKVRVAAELHHWVMVGDVENLFGEGHGYCAKDPEDMPGYTPGNPYPDDNPWPYQSRKTTRWIRTASESAELQGPMSLIETLEKMGTTGTMHPNELGHQAIKDVLLNIIFLPIEVPKIGRYDPDDQISEARTVSVGSSTKSRIYQTPDVDMFEFDVSSDKKHLLFELSYTTVSPWMRLFNGNGKVLAESESSAFWLEYTFDNPGKYFLGVSGTKNRQYDPVLGIGDKDGWSIGNFELVISALD
jgi:ketosteroid isomerase-like protein/lysophospholipase L1-like esterase